MTTIPVLKSLASVILSRLIDRRRPAAASPVLFRLARLLFLLGGMTVGTAATGQDMIWGPFDRPLERAAVQIAQSLTPSQRQRSAARNAQVKQAQAHCRKISQQFRNIGKTSCIRGDRLDRARSICVPPKGIFKLYSRWDPAAGRCKPRHRFDGGTCAGGKRRYKAGKHHAQEPSQSVRMYAKAPTRLAAAHKMCQRGIADLRSRIAAERVIRQRSCADARQQNDRSLVNLYCK